MRTEASGQETTRGAAICEFVQRLFMCAAGNITAGASMGTAFMKRLVAAGLGVAVGVAATVLYLNRQVSYVSKQAGILSSNTWDCSISGENSTHTAPFTISFEESHRSINSSLIGPQTSFVGLFTATSMDKSISGLYVLSRRYSRPGKNSVLFLKADGTFPHAEGAPTIDGGVQPSPLWQRANAGYVWTQLENVSALQFFGGDGSPDLHQLECKAAAS